MQFIYNHKCREKKQKDFITKINQYLHEIFRFFFFFSSRRHFVNFDKNENLHGKRAAVFVFDLQTNFVSDNIYGPNHVHRGDFFFLSSFSIAEEKKFSKNDIEKCIFRRNYNFPNQIAIHRIF